MGLSQDAKDLIDASRREFLQDHITRIGSHWTSASWLPEGNRYLRLRRRQLADEFNKLGKPRTQYQLAEYLAASSFGHVMDGWAYLGRAIAAQLVGDGSAAAHLAYYAELRGAMSVLATEGIGVFDNVHVVLKDKRRCGLVRDTRTHDFAWLALDYWAGSARAEDLVTRVIRPGGLAIADWLRVFGGGGQAISTNWIKAWGLDLDAFRADRDVRNTVSYRPSILVEPGEASVGSAVEAIESLWNACEPVASWPFAMLDRALLLSALRTIHESTTGKRPDQDIANYQSRVDRMIRNLQNTPPVWANPGRLLRTTNDDSLPRVLKNAGLQLDVTDQRFSLSVMARAALLLRLATGSVADVFGLPDDAKHAGSEFWWSEYGLRRGLWAVGSEPGRFEDLWADASNALTDLTAWSTTNGDQRGACGDLWSSHPRAAHSVSLTERIGLLGMAL